jgi:anti-sigma-K factor RskA
MTEDLHTYAGLYALDALDGPVLHEFEAHLANCADCRQEVDEFHSTAGRLASLEAAAPPPALRASVLTAIKDVRQEAPSTVTPLRRRPRWLAPLAVAAAIMLAFGIVRTAGGRSSQPTAASVVHAKDSRAIPLTGPDGVRTVAYFSPSLDRIAVSADGMDPAPDGKSYQLWLIGPGGPESAGLMEPTAGEHLDVLLAGKASGHQTVAITLEPRGGRPQPTGPILVKGDVTL